MQNIPKGYKNIFIVFLTVFLIFITYYIVVNTIMLNVVMPNIYLDGENISFKSVKELEIKEKAFKDYNLNKTLVTEFEGQVIEIPMEKIIKDIKISRPVNFAKGANPVKVFVDSLNLIDGQNFETQIDINTEGFISELPVKFSNENSAFISQKFVYNCEKNTYNFNIDHNKLKQKITNSIIDNKFLVINLDEIISDTENKNIYQICKKYNDDMNLFVEAFGKLKTDFEPKTILKLKIQNNSAEWIIYDQNMLKNFLNDHKRVFDIKALKEKNELIDGKILVLGLSNDGRSLNIDKSVQNIQQWILSPTNELPLEGDSINYTNSLVDNNNVFDFTKRISTGTTRIDLVRNGRQNAAVPNAQAGVEEINNSIIMPGEEFSFIKAVGLQKIGNAYFTKSGKPLGSGTCNSTTTLFRAALEGGFPIIERQNHTYLVGSYLWGYEMNIVDAAYYPNPRLDVKFKNDLNYPILLKTRVYVDNFGYQYHSIDIFSNKESSDRQVLITNFRKYDIVSELLFTGSFDRIIKENGIEINRETFTSRYWQLYPF